MTHFHNKCIFYINLANKISGTDSTFQYFLLLNPSVNNNKVVLLSANIPKTYYQVQNRYNTFILVESTHFITITVSPGTYSRNLFAIYLSTLLTNSSLSGFLYTITVLNTIFQPETGLFTYNVSGNSGIQP